jgi:tetratricopeptide (TPR) repeat protein
MKALWTLVLFLAVAIALAQGVTTPRTVKQAAVPAPKKPNVEIEIAKQYAQLGDWSEAETHFLAAAKDPDSQAEALAGLEDARRKADEAQTAVLAVGKHYEDAEMWSKAEDLYRSAAADKSLTDEARKEIGGRLTLVLEKQHWDRRWAEAKDWMDRLTILVGYAVIAFALLLAIATFRSIAGRRRIILIRPFAASTDENAKGVAIQLKYAREMMRNPALAPAGQVPPALVAMMLFDDESEPIEDVELAGAKIPFSALAKLFGRPGVQVGRSFDGVTPLGNAYSSIQTRGARADDFVQHAIRVGVPDQQRQDLRDFAYDVIRKAITANAIL